MQPGFDQYDSNFSERPWRRSAL